MHFSIDFMSSSQSIFLCRPPSLYVMSSSQSICYVVLLVYILCRPPSLYVMSSSQSIFYVVLLVYIFMSSSQSIFYVVLLVYMFMSSSQSIFLCRPPSLYFMSSSQSIFYWLSLYLCIFKYLIGPTVQNHKYILGKNRNLRQRAGKQED